MSSNVHQSNVSGKKIDYVTLCASRDTNGKGEWANYASAFVQRPGGYCRQYQALSPASVVRVQRAQRVMSARGKR